MIVRDDRPIGARRVERLSTVGAIHGEEKLRMKQLKGQRG